MTDHPLLAALTRTVALLAAVPLCLARCCRTRSPHPTRKDPILWTATTSDVRTGGFTLGRVEFRMRDEVMRQAQALVEAAVGSAENISLARDTATRWLQVFFAQLGWRITVVWM